MRSQSLWLEVFDTEEARYINKGDVIRSIPKDRSFCQNQETVFKLDAYKKLSLGKLSMHNTCFPIYVETQTGNRLEELTNPPLDSKAIPFVKLDRGNHQITWGRDQLDQGLFGTTWNITL